VSERGAETIRVPVVLRVVGSAFGVVWCLGASAGLVGAVLDRSPAHVLIILGLLAVGAPPLLRCHRVSVETRCDELLVRNSYLTHRLRRENLEGFYFGTGVLRAGPAIWVRVRGRRAVRLDATQGLYVLVRGYDLRERRLADLRAWAAQRSNLDVGSSWPAER